MAEDQQMDNSDASPLMTSSDGERMKSSRNRAQPFAVPPTVRQQGRDGDVLSSMRGSSMSSKQNIKVLRDRIRAGAASSMIPPTPSGKQGGDADVAADVNAASALHGPSAKQKIRALRHRTQATTARTGLQKDTEVTEDDEKGVQRDRGKFSSGSKFGKGGDVSPSEDSKSSTGFERPGAVRIAGAIGPVQVQERREAQIPQEGEHGNDSPAYSTGIETMVTASVVDDDNRIHREQMDQMLMRMEQMLDRQQRQLQQQCPSQVSSVAIAEVISTADRGAGQEATSTQEGGDTHSNDDQGENGKDQNQDETHDESNRFCRNLKRAAFVVLALVVILVVVVVVLLTVNNDDSDETYDGAQGGDNAETATNTTDATNATPTPGPMTNYSYMSFNSRQELFDAVDAYLSDDSPSSDAAIKYGYPIGNWDVSRIDHMSELFSVKRNPLAAHFDEDLRNWKVSRVWDISEMFFGAASFTGKGLKNWDVSMVQTLRSTFQGASTFDEDLSQWTITPYLWSLESTFEGASSFRGEGIGSWDVSAVQTMLRAFAGASQFEGNLSAWDVSTVWTTESMFASASSFNSDLGDWKVGSVQSMGSMFENASAFDQDLSRWDVSYVWNLGRMFKHASSFSRDLCLWGPQLPSTVMVSQMFQGTNCPDTADPDIPPSGYSATTRFCYVC